MQSRSCQSTYQFQKHSPNDQVCSSCLATSWGTEYRVKALFIVYSYPNPCVLSCRVLVCEDNKWTDTSLLCILAIKAVANLWDTMKKSAHRLFTSDMECWETSWNSPIEWFLKLVVGNGPEVVLQPARAFMNLIDSYSIVTSIAHSNHATWMKQLLNYLYKNIQIMASLTSKPYNNDMYHKQYKLQIVFFKPNCTLPPLPSLQLGYREHQRCPGPWVFGELVGSLIPWRRFMFQS